MYLVLPTGLPLDGMWATVRDNGELKVGHASGGEVPELFPADLPSFFLGIHFRQVEIPNPQSRDYYGTLKTFSDLVPDLDLGETEPPEKRKVLATAVEVVTRVPQTQDTDEDMEVAKRRCLEFLVDFLRVCRSVNLMTGPPPTFDRLPAFAVIQTRHAITGHRDDVVALLLPTADVVLPEMPDITKRQFEGLLRNFNRMITRDPIFICQEYKARAEASFALGDYSDVVISAAIASEVLLDHVLGLMLYEEGVSAADARVVWDGTGLATRLKTQYTSRLGGPWNREIEAWKEKVARLRGRIVHAGYRPSGPESEAALLSYGALNEFLRKRLVEKRIKYPWSTLQIAGLSKVREEGKLNGKFKAFVEGLDLSDPWLEHYLKWRDEAR
jgi:hypothetical protein